MEQFDPLSGHEIHSSLKELLLLQSRKELSAKHFNIGPSHAHALGRIFRLANDAKLIISKLAPDDVDLEILNDLNNGVASARNELLAFISNGNPGHIDNAKQHTIGAIMPQLKRLIPIGFDVHPRTESALEVYRMKARSAAAELNASLAENARKIEQARSELDAQSQQISSLAAQINDGKTENERLVSDLREADLERVERQSKEASNTISLIDKELQDFKLAERNRLSTSISLWENEVDEKIGELKKREEEARNIVQSVGELLTTGTYADRANTEMAKADTFRKITIGLFVFGLLIIISNYLIYALAFSLGKEVALAETWQALTARLVTGLAVTLPAFYTARESARHRTNADTAKQRELEISTLGPFIELLPEDEKSAIRARLTDRYFGNQVEPHVFNPPYDAEALVRSITEIARRTGGDGA